jgi:hypothetical protein
MLLELELLILILSVPFLIVRVSSGSSSAIHQVSYACDTQNVVVTPGPFAARNNTSGLGTFGGQSNSEVSSS